MAATLNQIYVHAGEEWRHRLVMTEIKGGNDVELENSEWREMLLGMRFIFVQAKAMVLCWLDVQKMVLCEVRRFPPPEKFID
jgi:hypothetical protein